MYPAVKSGVKVALITVFSSLVFAAWLARPERSTAAAGELEGSRALYNAHCAVCHGRDGRANTPKGRETEADDITGGVSTAKTVRVVTNGKGEMPSFRRRLTKAQISSIAAYVAKL